ncbi:MAG: arginase family protein [Deltaproteobacteria bacterium]|jgi:agmatinase|nr:arginase family protein [Deltaproteobacteria bacterium]
MSYSLEEGLEYMEGDLTISSQMPLCGMPEQLLKVVDHKFDRKYDISFLGVPYDYGSIRIQGSATAPDKLREISQRYQYDDQDNKTLGWFDLDSDTHLLEGVRMCDCGNVWWLPGESPKQIFGRIEKSVAAIKSEGSLPVIMGGDHSITYPCIHSYGKTAIGVIWIDAHADFKYLPKDTAPNHANVLRAISKLPNVKEIIWIGGRGIVSYSNFKEGDEFRTIKMISQKRLISEGMKGVEALISNDLHYHISIDVDVIDPNYAPGTGTPLINGMKPDELISTLKTIASKCKLASCDIVEINPAFDDTDRTAQHALRAAFHLLDEASHSAHLG